MIELDKELKDLYKQATKERSHYYVGSVVKKNNRATRKAKKFI